MEHIKILFNSVMGIGEAMMNLIIPAVEGVKESGIHKTLLGRVTTHHGGRRKTCAKRNHKTRRNKTQKKSRGKSNKKKH